MKEIIPKGIRRGKGYLARPLSEIARSYQLNAGKNVSSPMVKFISALAIWPESEDLFAYTSMGSLMITANEKFYFNDNVLRVSYRSEAHEFEFEHHTLSGKNDAKKCGEGDALQTLILFLKYKFGVLVDPNSAVKAAK